MTEEKKVYDKLGDAVGHLHKMGQETNSQAQVWANNFEEFTGYKPNQPINAFDVVKLMYKFYGEPKRD